GDARAHRRRVQALARKHHARLEQRLVVLRHLGDELGVRHRAGLGLVVALGNNDHHESHGCVSFRFRAAYFSATSLSLPRPASKSLPTSLSMSRNTWTILAR